MSARRLLLPVLALAALLPACASLPGPLPTPLACQLDAYVLHGNSLLSPGGPSATVAAKSAEQRFDELISQAVQRADPQLHGTGAQTPFDLLAISGGGAVGAYGAGFLERMLEKSRPGDPVNPRLVTGVSTGAVMAPYVYLATSTRMEVALKYREKLRKLYPPMDDAQLLRKRGLLELPFADAQYDVAGLVGEIALHASPALLRAIASEHADSKRALLVGAVNLRTGDFDVIDLAAVATQGDAPCFAAVIRASAAIPVLFPPVHITDVGAVDGLRDKLYADGGARHMLFLAMRTLAVEKRARLSGAAHRPVRLFGVVNSTLTIEPLNDPAPGLLTLAGRAATVVSDELHHASAFRADRLVRFGTEAAPAAHDSIASSVQDDVRSAGCAPGTTGNCAGWAVANRDRDANQTNWPPPCQDLLPEGKIFHPDYQACLYKLGASHADAPTRWRALDHAMPDAATMKANAAVGR